MDTLSYIYSINCFCPWPPSLFSTFLLYYLASSILWPAKAFYFDFPFSLNASINNKGRIIPFITTFQFHPQSHNGYLRIRISICYFDRWGPTNQPWCTIHRGQCLYYLMTITLLDIVRRKAMTLFLLLLNTLFRLCINNLLWKEEENTPHALVIYIITVVSLLETIDSLGIVSFGHFRLLSGNVLHCIDHWYTFVANRNR